MSARITKYKGQTLTGRHALGELCASTGKRRFRSEAHAQREIDRAAQDRVLLGQSQRQECRAYLCDGPGGCWFWHLTSHAAYVPPQPEGPTHA